MCRERGFPITLDDLAFIITRFDRYIAHFVQAARFVAKLIETYGPRVILEPWAGMEFLPIPNSFKENLAPDMDAPNYLPGPTPNTLRAADGTILTAPEGWAHLPPGDAGLTRRVKAAGDHWVVQDKVGRRTFSRGVWAPAATIDRIRAELDAERSTEGYARTQAGRLPEA